MRSTAYRVISKFIALTLLFLPLVGAKADDWASTWSSCATAKGDDAINSCTRLISNHALPNQRLATAYNNRSVARLAKRDFMGAIADLDRALQLNRSFALGYSNRCLARMAAGDLEGALVDCDKAIRLNPALVSAFSFRCDLSIARGNLDGAVDDCNHALNLDSKNALALSSRCAAWIAKNEIDRAITDCDAALRLNPSFVLAYNNRCFAKLTKGALIAAIADCDRAIELGPNLPNALGNRCGANLASGKYEAAMADCSRALDLDPNFTAAHVNRGIAFEHAADREHAIADFQAALNKPPKYLTGRSFQEKAREHLASLGIDTAESASPRSSIALKATGGTLFVPVTINGAITLNFMIDSGASDVSVPSDVVSTLIRSGTIERDDFIGTQTYILADGSELPSRTFVIRSLKVGDVVIENIQGSILPVAGNLLLGQSFLRRFKSWSIDNLTQELVLVPRELARSRGN